jgi:hypothetical protein
MTDHECATCGGECGIVCDDCVERHCPDCDGIATGRGLCSECIESATRAARPAVGGSVTSTEGGAKRSCAAQPAERR